MKKNLLVFTFFLFSFVLFATPKVTTFLSTFCFDFADDRVANTINNPNFGEPLTYEQEHALWLFYYDACNMM